MSTLFSQFDLHPKLVQTVADRGYTKPTPIQSALIPHMINGRDVVGQAQTGTGKTAAFALPMINGLEHGNNNIQGLVLTPTRELAVQVAGAVYDYGHQLGKRVLPIYGGQSYSRQLKRINKGVDIVVATPGRLLDLIRKGKLDLSHVRTVVLDEADEMLSMGFIDDIEAILNATPSERQTAFFSATMPKTIERLADRHMSNRETCRLEPNQRTADNIDQRYYIVKHHDRLDALTSLLEAEATESVIVFARTRRDTFKLAASLKSRGYKSGALNGEMNQSARNRMLDSFRSREIDVLVGTDVASRGLDIDHISHVINYAIPRDPQVYVHRVGRTGRAGKAGIAITLITNRERKKLHKIERYTKSDMTESSLPSEQDIQQMRDERLATRMSKRLQTNGYEREREIATQLIDEGHDPLDIAAAALKTSRKESASMGSTNGTRKNGSHKNGSSPRKSKSHESGMVRLKLNLGKTNGARPGHVVSSLAHFGGINGDVIGKINIRKRHTKVDVPADLVDKLLSRNGNYKMCNQMVELERA